jgi:hypothetical protein
MLFIAERVTELAAISSRELPPLCAIAPALESAKTVASVIVETLIVNSPFGRWISQTAHAVAGNQIVRIDGGIEMMSPSGHSVN